jgi:DNA-binding Lrp family transcriptional regulator
MSAAALAAPAPALDPADRAVLAATQRGLPVVVRPFAAVAATLDMDEDEVIARLARLQERGIVRRVAAAPNHYRLGMTANGMTVWDVDDARAAELGAQVGALEIVSHCYLRPRTRPVWPYNLFAMVHGGTREEVEEGRARIRALLGPACAACDVLYSTRILKKTGLRLGRAASAASRESA